MLAARQQLACKDLLTSSGLALGRKKKKNVHDESRKRSRKQLRRLKPPSVLEFSRGSPGVKPHVQTAAEEGNGRGQRSLEHCAAHAATAWQAHHWWHNVTLGGIPYGVLYGPENDKGSKNGSDTAGIINTRLGLDQQVMSGKGLPSPNTTAFVP